MDTGISIKILYWSPRNDDAIADFEGIEEFRNELIDNYVSSIHGRPGDLGGGLNEFFLELVSNINLSDVVKFIGEGIAFDLLKGGTKAFVLRPFINAYKKLKDKNKNNHLDIYSLTICFNDSIVHIYKITEQSILEELETIFKALAIHYNNLLFEGKEKPYEIHIPLFEEPERDRKIKYRKLFEVDEIIENVTVNDYYKYWGVNYDYAGKYIVYDLHNNVILDTDYSLDDYCQN